MIRNNTAAGGRSIDSSARTRSPIGAFSSSATFVSAPSMFGFVMGVSLAAGRYAVHVHFAAWLGRCRRNLIRALREAGVTDKWFLGLPQQEGQIAKPCPGKPL